MSLLKRLSIVVCFLVFTGPALAQSSLTYSDPNGSAEGYEVIPTNDGGYMVGGHATDAAGANQYWVVKVNNKGAVAWDSIYDLGYSQAFLWSIQPSDDGGALLAGYTGIQNSGQESALMLKIDSVGRLVKAYDVNYARADHGHWFAHRKQGGYFWGGHTDSEGDPTGDMILQKLDANMNKLWDSTYAFQHNTGEHAHCGTLTSDGGCVLAGHTTVNGQEHTWAVRVDSNGKRLWMHRFDSSATISESPYRVITTREGNFAIFGGSSSATTSGVRLLVVDSAGNKLVDKILLDGTTWAYSGIQTSDGGYALAGYDATQTDEHALIVKTDAKGNVQWSKEFTGEQFAWGYDVFQRKNQYVLVGGTSPNTTAPSKLWVMYVDSLGNATSYDTTRPQLVFTLDSSREMWSFTKTDTVNGRITNTAADSAYFNFKSTYPSAFVNAVTIGNQYVASSTIVGIAGKESLPVKLVLSPYEPRPTDTAVFCYSVVPIKSEIASSAQKCVTLFPTIVNAVAGEISEISSLVVFPNPSANQSEVTISATLPLIRLEVYDCLGGLVKNFDHPNSKAVSWNTRDEEGKMLAAGVYYIRAQFANGDVRSATIVRK